MRIIFVTNNWTPYSGGVVSSIKSTTEQLRKAGHEVFIITLDFLGKQHTDPAHVIRVPCPIKFRYKQNHIAVPWRLYNYILQHIQKLKPDIIHVHHPFLLGQSVLKVAKRLGIPVVFTYHTIYESYINYLPFPLRLLKPIVKKRAFNFCKAVDGIIAPSTAALEHIKKNDLTTPISCIASGVQDHFFQPICVSKRWSHGPFQLLIVSRFTKEKNVPFVLDVFAQLASDDRFHLTLVGYGAEFEPTKQYAFQELCLPADRVRFVHKPPADELVQYYKDADLFLYASHTDVQPLVLAEAMAGTVPVIALDRPGPRALIQDGVNGFLVENAVQMREKVESIAQNSDLHVHLQRNAWKTAQQFRPEALSAKLIAFYQEIA